MKPVTEVRQLAPDCSTRLISGCAKCSIPGSDGGRYVELIDVGLEGLCDLPHVLHLRSPENVSSLAV